MLSPRIALAAAVSVLAILGLAPVLRGHGGNECPGGWVPQPPPLPPEPSPQPPGPAVPGPRAPPPNPSPRQGGAKGGTPTAPQPPPARPTTGGGGGATTKRGATTEALDRWEYWWEANEEPFLLAAGRLDDVTTAAGAAGFARAPSPAPRGPSAGALRTRALPRLLELLSAQEANVADASALALGHIVQADEANLALTPLVRALHHAQLSVRESATIALGMVGSSDALPTLRDLLHDTPKGRELTGHPAGVEQRLRAFAAAAIGLVGERSSFADLRRVVDDPLLAHQLDLQQLALLAMGLLRDAHDEVVPCVLELLGRRDVDRVVKAQAPIVLARLAATSTGASAARAGLSRLVGLAADARNEKELRRSAIVALGRIARAEDREAVDALADLVAREEDAVARHFALIALGEIGAGDVDPAAHAEAQRTIELVLLRELESPRRVEHRPFAALALGIWSRNAALPVSRRARAGERLLDQLDSCGNPSHRGAVALALGIAGVAPAAEPIAAAFAATKEPLQKGHLALALGLLHARAQEPALLRQLTSGRLDPGLELRLARALSMLGSRDATATLVERLRAADTSSELELTALALAHTGEGEALEPLVAVAADAALAPARRGVAAESLGVLATAHELPWNAVFEVDTNYLARTSALAQLVMLF